MSEKTAGSNLPGMALRLGGIAGLCATGGIHLDLYLTGYRHIATIGVLFLLQVISAFALALSALVLPKKIVALSAAGFALSTLAGYILSLWFGLFGFNEIRTTAGIVAGIIEILTFIYFAAWAAFFAPESTSSRPLPAPLVALEKQAPRALPVLGFLAFLALLLAEVYSGPTSTPSSSNSSASSASSGGASVHLQIKNFAFVPARVTVTPGERIVITNDDGVAHTFTAMPGSSPLGTFNTGDINPGATGSVDAPTTAGSYSFYCSIHPFMTGTLVVS